jgi:hypothetical protein
VTALTRQHYHHILSLGWWIHLSPGRTLVTGQGSILVVIFIYVLEIKFYFVQAGTENDGEYSTNHDVTFCQPCRK